MSRPRGSSSRVFDSTLGFPGEGPPVGRMAGLCRGTRRSLHAEVVRPSPEAQLQASLADLVEAVEKAADPVGTDTVLQGALAALGQPSSVARGGGLRSQAPQSPPHTPPPGPSARAVTGPPPELTPRSKRAWRVFSTLGPAASMHTYMAARRKALQARRAQLRSAAGRPTLPVIKEAATSYAAVA